MLRAIAWLLCILCTITVVCLLLSGCVNQYPERSGTSSQDHSESVRLVATSSAIVDICDRLDLDLVGVPVTSRALPERYATAEQVGAPMSPDLEVLRSLAPDFVLSPQSLIGDLQPRYASIGAASLFVDLRSVDGLYQTITALGQKFDRQDKAQVLVDEHDLFMEDYRKQNEGRESPTVLVLMGVPGSYVVATDKSYVGSLVALAGGTNVYADADQEFINVNTEDMQARDPDIVLRTAHALPDQVMQMFAEEFSTNDIWKHFRAVREGRVYDLPSEQFGMSAEFNYPEALEELRPLLYGSDDDE